MPSPTTTFRGTTDEATDLQTAILHNCECQYGFMGMRMNTCPLHEALASDQAWQDRMLFARRIRPRLLLEEGSTWCTWEKRVGRP